MVSAQDDTLAQSTETYVLKIWKFVDRTNAEVGDTINYTLMVLNRFPDPRYDIVVQDFIPGGTSYLDGSATGTAAYNPGLERLTWTIDSIPAWRTDTVYFQVVVDSAASGTTVANAADILEPSIWTSDTVYTDIDPIVYPPEIAVDKEVDRVEAYRGDTLRFTLDVTNNGAGAGENTVVLDNIPDFTTYLPGSITGGGIFFDFENLVQWTLPLIDPSETIPLSFAVTIDSAAPDSFIINNFAIFSMPDTGYSDTTSTLVLPDTSTAHHELDLVKAVDKDSAVVGDTLNYHLTITNSGDTSAIDIRANDYLPVYLNLLPGSVTENGVYFPREHRLEWSLYEIMAGEKVELAFAGVVDDNTPDGSLMVNIADIIFDDSLMADTAETLILPDTSELFPILEIEKTVDRDTALAGDTLAYSLQIKNTGTADANKVSVDDALPAHTEYIDGSASHNGQYFPATGRLGWTIDNLPPGQSLTLSFMAAVYENAPDSTDIENIGRILLPDSTVEDSAHTFIIPDTSELKPLLDIDKTVDRDTALVGDTLAYRLLITNSGPIDAGEVMIQDALSPFTEYVPGSAGDNGIFIPAANGLTWMVDLVPAGKAVERSFRAVIRKGTPENIRAVNYANIVIDDSLVTDSAVTFVAPDTGLPYTLTLEKTVNPKLARAGDTLTYFIDLGNDGPEAAKDIKVNDMIPPYTVFIDGSITGGGTYDDIAGQVNWMVDILIPGESRKLSFAVEIADDAPDSSDIWNFVDAVAPDTIYRDSAATYVLPGTNDGDPILGIVKTVDSDTAYAADTLHYYIKITNSGDEVAYEFPVSDRLPAFTEYVVGSAVNGYYDEPKHSVTWLIDRIDPGQQIDLDLMAVIDDDIVRPNDLANIALITLTDSIVADTANTHVKPDPIVFDPVVAITKYVDSLNARPGSMLTYTLEITNIGDTTIEDIRVEDVVPDLVTYVPGSVNAGGVFDPDQNMVYWDWTIGSIAPGHSITLVFSVTIDDDAPGGALIENDAMAVVPIEIESPAKSTIIYDIVLSNTVITVVNIPTGPDDPPDIVKTVDKNDAAAGDTLNYTITLANNTTDPINGIVVVDTIPDGTEYIAGSASGGAVYSTADNSLTWSIPSLAIGEETELTFAVEIDDDIVDGTAIDNRAVVVAPEPTIGNRVTSIVHDNLFTISKAADRAEVTVDDTVTYTISYHNVIGGPKTSIVIVDVLPDGLDYVNGSATGGGDYDPATRTVFWNIGTVAGGGQGTLQFRAVPDQTAENLDTYDNAAVVSGADIPTETSNIVTVTVRYPELDLLKSVDSTLAAPGGILRYTVTAVNNGAATLTDAVLVDDIPSDFTYMAGTATVNGAAATVNGTDPITISLGTIVPGETVTIVYDLDMDDDIAVGADYINTAVVRGNDNSGRQVTFGPAQATVAVEIPRLQVTKTAGAATAMTGSIIPYTVTVANISNVPATDVIVFDNMPHGFYYIDGSSLTDGVPAADPGLAADMYSWPINDLAPGTTVTLRYTVQVGASVASGINDNTAYATGVLGTQAVRSNDASARVNVIAGTLAGSIRGRVMADCDGDGYSDSDLIPVGVDIYLDDGSRSQVNEFGMFYFSTVRAGEHVVALDERDLDGFYVPDGAPVSVFVHVHETGESYVTFRVCPDQPQLKLTKRAAILPKVKVTKTARLNEDKTADSVGVTVDYEITIQSNGGALPAHVTVVDSFPDETRLIVHEEQAIIPKAADHTLKYDFDVAEKRMHQSVYYSLEDLAPGIRRFLTNKIHLEGDISLSSETVSSVISGNAEVSVGPFRMIPPRDIQLKVVGALFVTSKAFLQPPAFPILAAMADSIRKYADAEVRIEGHADYRPIHTRRFPSNWELSEARARSVFEYFAQTEKIDSLRLSHEGFAATRPVDTGHTMAALQKNRRVEIIVQARREGGVDLSGLTSDSFSSWTTLELNPVSYDSSFRLPSSVVTGLDDGWEVIIRVTNDGTRDAEDIFVTDILPDSARYAANSALLDGTMVKAAADGNRLVIKITRLDAGQTRELRYRLVAAEGTTPSGGGAAAARTVTPDGGTVTAESNTVIFE